MTRRERAGWSAARPSRSPVGQAPARRSRRILLLVACLLLVIIPTTLAYAGTNFNYAQGYFGAGGSFGTTGFAPRDYNRVWHAAGYEWWVFYELPNGSTACFRDNTNNPTSCPFSNSYAKSWCSNITDNSGVQWTCPRGGPPVRPPPFSPPPAGGCPPPRGGGPQPPSCPHSPKRRERP